MDLRSTESLAMQALHQALLERKLDFQAKFPQLVEKYQDSIVKIEQTRQAHFEAAVEKNTVLQATVEEAKLSHDENQVEKVLAVTQEEIDSIFFKISEFITTPGYVVNQDELLYLEQQLTDMVGFTVSSQLDTITLPYIWGTAKSLPHVKRHPTDTLLRHNHVHEANFTEKRSVYGWLSVVQGEEENSIVQEEYSVTLPLLTFEQLELSSEAYIQWFKYRKVLIINPYAKKMAVAQVSNIILGQNPKYALGLSPELSRNLETWRPPSQGKTFFLFIDHDQNEIPLGMLKYELTI